MRVQGRALIKLRKDRCMDGKEHQHIETNEHLVREQKVQALRAQNIEPWPENISLDARCADVIATYKADHEQEYTVAGRVMAIRGHGKSTFATIQDRSGTLQVYFKQDALGETQYRFFSQYIDTGDSIMVSGGSFKTKMGEISIAVKSFKLLSKSVRPLPAKFHGIVDQETKYRQRYLDLMSDKEVRDRFIKRSHIVRGLRTFLDEHDFMEVETPMLHPIPGGATARPFITHHNALDTDFYLRIAPELYLKRLVVGGLERVYEINRNFRNEGVSTRHNPEFTMLEFYTAYQDYIYIMKFIETMFRRVAHTVNGSGVATYGDHIINFDEPFDRISPKEAIIRYGGIPADQLTFDRIDVACATHKVPYEGVSHEKKVFGLFEACAERNIVKPTFIIDYPVEISPLAKRDAQDHNKAARFELFIAGMEIGNGFNELNDPYDQAERFHQQVKAQDAGDQEAMHYDADYIAALEQGLPPTVGVGIGIDRLTMLLTNTTTIKEVILFPALKHQKS